MFGTLSRKLIKVTALFVCLGIVCSACWVRGPGARYDHRHDYHEDHRGYR